MMEGFTPVWSLLGGVLIGVAASALLFFDGKVAGVSGIVGGLLRPGAGDHAWRVAFVAGLLAGGVLVRLALPSAFTIAVAEPPLLLVAAGLLVGFGTQLGNGCTSGHGVCGLSRGSGRSLVATATFMTAGALTVLVVRHVLAVTP
jgi:uncharacterized membrane protein YedE/YeeE